MVAAQAPTPTCPVAAVLALADYSQRPYTTVALCQSRYCPGLRIDMDLQPEPGMVRAVVTFERIVECTADNT
jgi:hypothetical protein